MECNSLKMDVEALKVRNKELVDSFIVYAYCILSILDIARRRNEIIRPWRRKSFAV